MKIPLSKPGTELALDHQRKICTVTPEAHRFVLRDSRLSHRRGRCCRSSEDPSPGDPEGDAKLQNTLVSMIKLEIGKKQVEEYVEESGEKLKQVAEEAKEEIEKIAELSKLRGDVAFDSALADINREADEFEEKLRRSREEQNAWEQSQASWEQDVAASRSEGQFFKSLYQTDARRPVGDSTEALRQRAQRVTSPAKEQMGSPARMYLFLGLAFLLTLDVGADLASDSPSTGPDILYTGLAALAVWLAFNERKALE